VTPVQRAVTRTREISAEMGVHAPRTSRRGICIEACAIERPAPRPSLGHRLIVPACALAALALFVLLALE
jgi:hypothetical protein